MDEAGQREMETRLRLWQLEIDDLVARIQLSGLQVGFDDQMRVDELKALHAIAQTRFDALKAAGTAKRPRLREGLTVACRDFEAALGRPGGRARRRDGGSGGRQP